MFFETLLELLCSGKGKLLNMHYILGLIRQIPPPIRALPLLSAWGIWLARNHAIFDGIDSSPSRCALSSIAILESFP